MDNRGIAKSFERIGKLLELKGENPFKSRAYFNAARTISRLPVSLKESASHNSLKSIKGIGDALEKKIIELLDTGKLEYLERLEKEIPPGHLDMLRILGLGSKKIRRLVDALGINTVGELEYACRENRLKLLKGFGAKSQENVLKGIAFITRFKDSRLYSEVKNIATEIVEIIDDIQGVQNLSETGLLRRCMEIVKNIDILIAAKEKDRTGITERFVSMGRVEKILARGETRVSFRLDNGMRCVIKMVNEHEFPCALHHFTGSAGHNMALRSYAKSIGLNLNEYGIFKGDKLIQVSDEADFFKKLGMAYIPPELREDTGEIEAAISNLLPDLIQFDDLRGLFHIHTVWSDGSNTIAEMADAAKNMGMEYIGISDHSRSASYAGGLTSDSVKRQWDEIEEFNSRNPGIYVFSGIESDILRDGSLDYDDTLLGGFDFVIASIHSGFSMSEREATERMMRAISHPAITILGHPTGRLLLGREGYPVDMEKILDACAEYRVVVELNANPLRLDIDWRYLLEATQRGVPVCINPDSHDVSTLFHVQYGINAARKGWLRKENVFNTSSLKQVMNMLSDKKNIKSL